MRILPILILGTIVLFVSGVVAPQRSKKLQGWVDDRLSQGERKGERRAGWVGDWLAKCLRAGQTVNAAAVRSGRRVRGWLPF
jgi:hypothetical protein